ncbi:hypothetical protein ACWJKU_17220 [Methylocaldum sp. MU1018]
MQHEKQGIEFRRESDGRLIGRIEITYKRVTADVEWWGANLVGYEERLFRDQLKLSGLTNELGRIFEEYKEQGGRHRHAFSTLTSGWARGVSTNFAERMAEVVAQHFYQTLDLLDPTPKNTGKPFRDYLAIKWRIVRGYCGAAIDW